MGLSGRFWMGLAVAMLAWGATLLLLLDEDEPAPARAAPGLRGSQLPPALVDRPAPRIVLADARGGRIDTAQLRGRPYAVTFLFTRCPDVCLIIGQVLKQATAALGPDAGRVAVIAVSVDPAGDTPTSVRHWLDRQRLPATFRYGVGTERDLAPVWEDYFAAPRITGRPETSTHSAAVWLVDAEGRLRTRHSAGIGALKAADVTADLRTLLAEARRAD